MANNENRDKLPIKLKSERFFITGSTAVNDTILTSSFELASASFAEKKYLSEDYLGWTEGAIIYQLQNMQDDMTNIHKEVSQSVYETSISEFASLGSASLGVISSSLVPDLDNKYDLGSSTKEWKNLYIDGTANLDRADIGAIGTNLIPVVPAKKGQGQTIGSDKARWSRIFLASQIDVSGSQLIISSPSASVAGDDFNVVVSGSIVPGDTDSGSLGSIDAPFKDLFIQSSSIYLADMSTHNFGSGNKSWKQMSKSEKLQRSTIFRKDDVDKLKRGESLNDSGHISASGDFHVVGSTHLKGTTLIEGNTTIDGLTDVKGGFRINGQAITDAELQALRGLATGNGSIQTQLNAKHATIDASNRLNANLIGGGNVSSIEFNQLDGIGTSTIATQLSAKQDTINFGIGNKEVIKCGTGIVDDDFLRIDGTSLEGLSASEVKTALSLVKGDVGLGNVDNTSDASKPVSTATQTALNKKLSLTGGTMTGLIQPIVTAMKSAPNKNTIDARGTNVFEFVVKQGATVDIATALHVGQEMTIVNLGQGLVTITHTGGKPAQFSFFISGGKNLSIATGQAYKFIYTNVNQWMVIQ